jgi:hypothetical protein
MREELSGDDVFNEIMMARTAFAGTFFILEGDNDCRWMDGFVDIKKCKTIPGHAKENVLDAVAIADRKHFEGVLGLVDADFDRLHGRNLGHANVCVTDLHDIDLMMMTMSEGVHRLVRQYCDTEKHAAFLQRANKPHLLSVAIESAFIIGILRWASDSSRLYLNFDKIDFSTFIDPNSLVTLKSDLIREVVGKTKSCRHSPEYLSGEMNRLVQRKPNLMQVVQGHDVAEVLSIALKITVGNCHAVIAGSRNIEKMCRVGFSSVEFKATCIYTWIKKWESDNAPYLVLRML